MLIATVGRVMMAVVLLVEDDFFIRELAEETIQEFGHHTHSASNMDEALFFLRSGQHIDALVADIRHRG
jgi:CheY-like chemotaxis protein